jgi:prepilin-type N-terminal cleavage/methylation domain-containing protein
MNSRRQYAAFTLIELLVVIAIIGIIAAIVGPSLGHFRKGDAMLSATRQMLDAVYHARQLAISQRTTVYMVFVPMNYWNNLSPAQQTTLAATNLADKQLTGYTFVSLRTVGDQPGQNVTNYLSSWKTLPDSTFIDTNKFKAPGAGNSFGPVWLQINDPVTAAPLYYIYGFKTNAIPFPMPDSPPVIMPSIGFDYLGRLVSGQDEYIPLAHGSVSYTRNPVTKGLELSPPSIQESPSGNSVSSYNVIHIDWLTGRARLEHREIQ